MNSKDKMIKMLSSIFDMDEDLITPDTTKDQLPEWDSLASAQIIMAFEYEFNMHLTDEQIENIHSFDDILRLAGGGE